MPLKINDIPVIGLGRGAEGATTVLGSSNLEQSEATKAVVSKTDIQPAGEIYSAPVPIEKTLPVVATPTPQK